MFRLTISLLLLIFTINFNFAQKPDDAVFFNQNKQIGKFHSIDDLQTMKKGELLQIYKDRVKEIMSVLPLLSVANESGVRLRDVGIKEDSRHLKILKNNKEATDKSLEATNQAIEELVPYADTEKIIGTILYFEEIIKKMRIGVNTSF